MLLELLLPSCYKEKPENGINTVWVEYGEESRFLLLFLWLLRLHEQTIPPLNSSRFELDSFTLEYFSAAVKGAGLTDWESGDFSSQSNSAFDYL